MIYKLQNGGMFHLWNKAYNSKFGNTVRTFMFGKDYNLSNEEYQKKHGYAKPLTGTGMLPSKTSMNVFGGIENLTKGSYGTGAVYNAGKQMLDTERAAFKSLEKFDNMARLNKKSLEWTGKKYNELSKSEQYLLNILKK